MNYNSILLRLPAVVRGRFNLNGLLHFAVLLLLAFSTPVQAQTQPKNVGPVDERLTMPRNPVARNAGVWNGGSEDGGDMTFSMLQFRKNGFHGNEYTSCFGIAFFHQQHIVRLPDRNGHAYFIVTASKAYVPDEFWEPAVADGRMVVYRTDRVDPVTGLIPTSNRPDGTDGEIVWEHRFTQYSPVGWWNHPCKMELIGGLLLVSMQNWDGEGGGGGFCKSGQLDNQLEALVFFDVRDPENPKHWGTMTQTELGVAGNLPVTHVNNASLVQAGDEWILLVGTDSSHAFTTKWWHTRNITPRMIDWIYGGTGSTASASQQGSFFNSYESYNPPLSAPTGTTLQGTERVMWGNADGDEGSGDAGEVSGDEAVYFSQLNFAPSGNPTSVNFAPTITATNPAKINGNIYPAPNMWIAPPLVGYGDTENHNSKKDYDSVGVSVVRGMPVFYSPLIWGNEMYGLTKLGNVPSPFVADADKIYQVWNPTNLALQSFPPPNQIVTTLADNGAGSLRRAISQGGNITFAPNLDGQTINLTGGPLVVYLADVNIDASALPNGINLQIFADTTGSKPAFVVADRSLTLNDALKKTVWVTSDPGAWFGQSTNTHDGVGAFQSGAINNSQQTYLQTAVAGPGTLTFWWKTFSEASGGVLAFQTDSNSISASVGGSYDWTQVTIPVPAGTHTLKWTYSKDAANSAGSDAAFLDQVVYIPLAPKMVIEQPPGTLLVGAGITAWGDNDQGQTTVPGVLTGVKAISAGDFDTVALRNDGTVTAWGANDVYNTGQTMIPPGLSGVSAIAAGTYHTLALKNDGTVAAWGNNGYGQTNIPPGLSNVTAIAANLYHSVALRSNGTVICWGAIGSDYGQTSVPTGLSGVTNIAAGAFHTVALKNDGTVVAWGGITRDFGQTNVPAGLTGVTAIAAGTRHTVALKSDGTVVAWGDDYYGQIDVPPGLSGVIAIAAGNYHTVALKSDGTVVAWGNNDYNQTNVPAGLSGVTLIAAGGNHTVAAVGTPTVAFGNQLNGTSSAAKTFTIKNTGTVALTLTSVSTLNGNSGDFTVNTSGMLTSVPAGGQTTFTVTFHPTALGARATTLSISSDGGNSSIALTGSGGVNAGVPEIALVLPTGTPATRIVGFGSQNINTTGAAKTFTIQNLGTAPLNLSGVSVVGGNSGQFIVNPGGMLTSIPAFSQTTFTVAFSPLAAGLNTTTLRVLSDDADEPTLNFPLTGNGRIGIPNIALQQPAGTPLGQHTYVVAWGLNDHGQTNVPAGLSGVSAVAAGASHSLALKSDGTVVAWGYNDWGQTNVPFGLSNVTAVAAGSVHSVALKQDGTITAWGSDADGERTVPPGVNGVTAIAAGGLHTMALLSNGTVVAWGYNNHGQTNVPLGLSGVSAIAAGSFFNSMALMSNGTVAVWGWTQDNLNPVPPGLSGVSAISLGGHHVATLQANGTFLAWGNNDWGQTTLPGGVTGVVAVAAGNLHTVALKNDGTVAAWGYNPDGEAPAPAGLTGVTAIATHNNHSLALVGRTGLDFGSFITGEYSPIKTVTITNSGTGPLVITGVITTNGNRSDFIVDTSGMLTSVPAGGYTTFQIRFAPIASGPRSSSLRVLSDDPDEDLIDIPLTGSGGVNAGVPKIALALPTGSPPAGNVVAWGYGGAGATTVPAGLGTVRGIATAYLYSAALKTDGTVVTWGDFNGGNTNQPAGVTGVVAIASAGHMVALKSDGTVVTWGEGTEGTVPAGLNQVTAVAAGDGFTLALKQDGSVRAWGNNNLGQTNVPAAAQSDVLAIAANGGHALALKTNGSVVAWGSNTDGESTVPASALGGVIAIAAGGGHSLAIKTNGSVIAWGRDVEGQTTLPAAAMSGVIAVEGGIFNSVALKNDGTVLAWGYGGLGVTTIPPALTGVVAISAHGNHVLAMVGTPSLDYGHQSLNTSSAARTFTLTNSGTGPLTISSLTATNGNTNDFLLDTIGMITNVPAGSNTTFRVSFSPTALGLRSTTVRIVSNDTNRPVIDILLTGSGTNLVVGTPNIVIEQPAGQPVTGGLVTGWGNNDYGQKTAPANLSGVTAITAGLIHTVALKNDGTVVAWGYNDAGQTNVPVGLNGVTAIAAQSSGNSTLALKSDGTVVGWGYNGYGQNTAPAGLGFVSKIAAGAYHTLALKSDGTVLAWGDNDNQQTNVPAGLSGVTAVAGGAFFSMALKNDHTVVAWGNNTYGQTNVPAGLSGVTAIGAGTYHAVALKDDGTVVVWGNNSFGQLNIPVGLNGVSQIAVGGFHTVALKYDGTVVAWGYNDRGQTNVPAGLFGVTAIAAGYEHTVAVGPTAISFGNQNIGSTSAAKTFTIKNTGTGPLHLGSVSVVGGNSGDFTVNTSGMLFSIPASGQTTISVTFTPGAVGARTTVLRILSDDPDNEISNLTLTGTGTGTVNPFPLTGMTRLPNGSFQFSFTNTSGLSFSVLASTNVALPLSNWILLGAPLEVPPGQYQFTDSQATNNLQRFYRVHSP